MKSSLTRPRHAAAAQEVVFAGCCTACIITPHNVLVVLLRALCYDAHRAAASRESHAHVFAQRYVFAESAASSPFAICFGQKPSLCLFAGLRKAPDRNQAPGQQIAPESA